MEALKELTDIYNWRFSKTLNIQTRIESEQQADYIGSEPTEEFIHKAAAELANLQAAVEVLKRIEFIETDDGNEECPVCRIEKPWHSTDCELAAAIQKVQS